jgi:hypothetical protein
VKNVNFTQIISFHCDQPDKLVELAAAWDLMQAEGDVMGYMGSHILVDRDQPDRYLLVAEFGVVDPDVSAAEEAMRNNDRPETQEWAEKLLQVITGEPPEYHNYDEIYRTG